MINNINIYILRIYRRQSSFQRADRTFTADVNGFTMRFEWIILLRPFCLFFPFHTLSDLFRTHFIFELRKTFNLSPRKRELIRARVSAIIFNRKWSKVSNKRAWSRRMRVHHFDTRSPLRVQLLLLLLEIRRCFCCYFITILNIVQTSSN